jgi:hypothetical protein
MSERAERYVSDYVRVYEGAYRVADTRVSLSSVVIHWRQLGRTPEELRDSWQRLPL